MRSLSMLLMTAIAALGLTTACTPSKNTVRYNKRSANACPVEKKSSSKAKDSKKESDKDAWSDSYDLQASGTDLWADVKVVLTGKCAACHAGYDTYDTAKTKIDVYIERMERTAGAVGFMPQGGAKTDADLALLQSWKDAGTPQSGSGGEDDGAGEDDGLDDSAGEDDGSDDNLGDDDGSDDDSDDEDDDSKNEDC